MIRVNSFLPFEGRWHAQRDGGVQAFDAMRFADARRYPSTALRAVSLPLRGRISA